MKKLALVLAILMVAAFNVQASDFSAGGSYRAVYANEDPGSNIEPDDAFYQRMRVAFNWKVNDNVSTQLRGDFAEFTWGDGYRPEAGTDTIMIDRAFATIKSGALTLKVGQQAGAWGLGTMWSDQFAGIQADIALDPITIKLLYQKESEGGAAGNTTTDEAGNDDDDVYGIAAVYKADAFTGQLSFATKRQKSDGAGNAADHTMNGYSLTVIVPIGDMKLSAEGTMFGGDNGSTTDYVGTQFYANLDAKLSDMISAKVGVVWADGADSNESQITSIQHDVQFRPLDFEGALGADRGLSQGSTVLANDTQGTETGRTQLFEAAVNRGVIGLIGGVKVAATDAVTLYGKLGYIEPNDNDDTTSLDSKTFAIASVDYAWMPAVTVSGGVAYVSPDYSDGTINDDPVVEWIFRLGVSF